MSESQSRTPVRIVVEGSGEAKGELIKFSAPLTVEALLKRLPLEGRSHPQQGGYSFIIGIRRGAEKAVGRVKGGGHRLLANAGRPLRLPQRRSALQPREYCW